MDLWIWISLAATLSLVALVALRRRPEIPAGAAPAEEPARSVPRRPSARREPFHAVTVRHGLEACQAVVKIAGQRFLAGQAPNLPLPGCDAARCQCRYVHHADRRAPHDRRNPWSRHGGFDPRRGHTERRAKTNRRQRPWRPPRQP